MTCRLCEQDIPNGADVHYDCLMKTNTEAMNRYCMMPFGWGVNLVKFMRTYEFDEPEGVMLDLKSGPKFIIDEPCCYRCYKEDFGDGPYEDEDGDYICESCYMDDVNKAETLGEGDR